MQSNNGIKISSTGITGLNVTWRKRHFAKRTHQSIHMNGATIVSRCEIDTNPVELNVFEYSAFRSQNRILGFFGQGPYTSPLVADEGSESDLTAVLGDLSYASSVRPYQPSIWKELL